MSDEPNIFSYAPIEIATLTATTETNMKITDQDFDNAEAEFGFEIAADARIRASAAYQRKLLAGFDQATCEAAEAAAWYAYFNDEGTDE